MEECPQAVVTKVGQTAARIGLYGADRFARVADAMENHRAFSIAVRAGSVYRASGGPEPSRIIGEHVLAARWAPRAPALCAPHEPTVKRNCSRVKSSAPGSASDPLAAAGRASIVRARPQSLS